MRRTTSSDAERVAVRRVDDERVDLGVDERVGALERVGADADGRGDAQAAAVVLRRERVRLPLRDVLDGDQALEPAVDVDDRELLDAVPAEDRLRLLERRADRRGDEARPSSSRRRPRIVDGTPKRRSRFVRMPTSMPSASVIGTPGDAVAGHQLERVADERVGRRA